MTSTIKLNLSGIDKINIKGQGGQESKLVPLFPDYDKVNNEKYDFVNRKNKDDRIECKKQEDLQWFDIGKYHEMNDLDKQVKIVFVLHKKGVIDTVFYLTSEKFIQLACSKKSYQENGWTYEGIKDFYYLKKKYPTAQSKVKIKMRSFYNDFRDQVTTLFTKS